MRIISINVNGIRAAARKGLFTWLKGQRADVVCLQEVRAQIEQLSAPCYYPKNYHCEYFDAERKGYGGVAIYSRIAPGRWVRGFGVKEFDAEGRYLEARFDAFSVVSLYAPSGSSGDERQRAKFRFLDAFMRHLEKLKRSRRRYIICGDWNIAHKPIDLKNWRSNQKNSGFLPEERAWMDRLFDEVGYNDAFREVCEAPEQYTWWSNRGRARQNNVGWRIDYQITSPALLGCARKARIYKQEWFSDHAPLIMDYDLPAL